MNDTKGAPPTVGKKPPYKAKAVANYFLDRGQKEGVALSQMKLQKLIYFSHGWHLALLGKPLIDELVQAWEFGPVVRTIYDEFKNYGKDKITGFADSLEIHGTKLTIYKPEIPAEDEQTRDLLARVWKVYKGFSAYQLSAITHADNSPWEKAYSANPGVRNLTINDADIKTYFEQIANANRHRAAG